MQLIGQFTWNIHVIMLLNSPNAQLGFGNL